MAFFITGATAGLGAEMTRRFATEGHGVVASGRRRDRLDALAAEFGQSVLPVVMDVSDKTSIQHALASLPPEWNEIDVPIKNSGLALGMEPAQKASLGDWETMIATSCTGMITLTHAALPAMVARGRGTVINIGSTAGAYPCPGGNAFGASKAFVEHFITNLRGDLNGTRVRATTIARGMCGGTEFYNVGFKDDDAAAQKIYIGAAKPADSVMLGER